MQDDHTAVCRQLCAGSGGWEGVSAHSMQAKEGPSQGTALTHTDTYQHLLQLVN